MSDHSDLPKSLDQVGALLRAASALTNHRHFVIAGSLSILPIPSAPGLMKMSPDVDLYPRDDPGRAGEIAKTFGLGSSFAQSVGVYADAISPAVLTLPEGWEDRLVLVDHGTVVGHYLEANDTAVAKLSRGSGRDKSWVLAGLRAGVLDASVIERRMESANFLDQAEHDRSRTILADLVVEAASTPASEFARRPLMP